MELKLVSWNVWGLDDKIKRALMFKYLSHDKPHILFLQVAHLLGNKILAIHRPWIQQSFHATYSSYAKGVAILLNSFRIKVLHLVTDPEGCYIILLLKIKTIVYAMVNVHAPPPFNQQVLYAVYEKLATQFSRLYIQLQ